MSNSKSHRFTVERVSKPYGFIESMSAAEAARKIVEETGGKWSEFAAKEVLGEGSRIETPVGRYVAPSRG
jgi:hypothetical protein